eukprot:3488827-Amphidinium_carterae.1
MFDTVVGPYHTGQPNAAGDTFLRLLQDHYMVAANTFYQNAGPTFFPLTAVGRAKTLDYLCVPAGHLLAIEKCCALWKQGRRLQLINSAERKDHIPLLLVLQYELRFDKTVRERTSWDYNLLAQALQRGRGRE